MRACGHSSGSEGAKQRIVDMMMHVRSEAVVLAEAGNSITRERNCHYIRLRTSRTEIMNEIGEEDRRRQPVGKDKKGVRGKTVATAKSVVFRLRNSG
jgi:hypothetical protein